MTLGKPAEICWIVTGTEGFGVGRTIDNLSAALADRGLSVGFLALSEGNFTVRLRSGEHSLSVLSLPAIPPLEAANFRRSPLRFVIWLLRSLRAAWAIRRHSCVRSADVVHFLWPHLLLAVGLRFRRKQVVVWEMANAVSSADPLAAFLYRTLARVLRVQVVANSQYTARSLSRATVRPVPVMHLSSRISPEPQPVKRSPEVARLLMAARVHPSKMQKELIAALGALDVTPSVELTIVGFNGTLVYEEEVREAAGLVSRQPRKSIHLIAARDNIEDHFARTDVVISLRRDAEPFGLTVIEAMMAGRPVLATALGGPSETIIDGRTGWLVPCADQQSLLGALARVLRDADRWPEMGAAARRHALARFSPALQAQRYLEILATTGPGQHGVKDRDDSSN